MRVRGTDVLVPDLLGRVTILGGDDQLVTHLGIGSEGKWVKPEGFPDVPKEKRVEGELIAPHDAIWDHDGNLYVVEWVPDGRVSKWRRRASSSFDDDALSHRRRASSLLAACVANAES